MADNIFSLQAQVRQAEEEIRRATRKDEDEKRDIRFLDYQEIPRLRAKQRQLQDLLRMEMERVKKTEDDKKRRQEEERKKKEEFTRRQDELAQERRKLDEKKRQDEMRRKLSA